MPGQTDVDITVPDMRGMPVSEAVRRLSALFERALVDDRLAGESPAQEIRADARIDARRLVLAATGLSNEHLVMDPARRLTGEEANCLAAFAARRLAREPVTRIEGVREFYGRRFVVTPDTLDPRPDTETLVELALDLAREIAAHADGNEPLGILDIGTGTGCILLTLVAELRSRGVAVRGFGADVSSAALEVARENARRLGLADDVEWIKTDGGFSVLPAPALVVSNPPYIPSREIAGLAPEVRSYDPRLALDGGGDGLAIIRNLVQWSAVHPATWFAIEFGAGQHDEILELISRSCGALSATAARFQKDLGGHTRCVAWKPQKEMALKNLLAFGSGTATQSST